MESICIKVNITKLAGIKTQLPEFLFQATNYDTSCTSTNLQILQKKKKNLWREMILHILKGNGT